VSLFISSIQYIKHIKGGVIVHIKNIKHPRIFPFDIFLKRAWTQFAASVQESKWRKRADAVLWVEVVC